MEIFKAKINRWEVNQLRLGHYNLIMVITLANPRKSWRGTNKSKFVQIKRATLIYEEALIQP